MILYTQEDGGTFVITDEHAEKVWTPGGRWVPAVRFRRVFWDPKLGRWAYEGKNHFTITRKRREAKFVPLDERNQVQVTG